MLTFPESKGIIRNPEGKRGASSAKDASIGAKISSAQEPTAFSSIPLHNYRDTKIKINYFILQPSLIYPFFFLWLNTLQELTALAHLRANIKIDHQHNEASEIENQWEAIKLTCKRNISLGIIASSGEWPTPSNLITSKN